MSRSKKTVVKATEPLVASFLCKIYGVPDADTLLEAADFILDQHTQPFPWSNSLVFYPWVTDVGAQVMGSKLDHMTEQVLSDPDNVYVVKDTMDVGKNTVWFVKATSPAPTNFDRPYRSVSNHFYVDGEWLQVTAIQASSCQR